MEDGINEWTEEQELELLEALSTSHEERSEESESDATGEYVQHLEDNGIRTDGAD